MRLLSVTFSCAQGLTWLVHMLSEEDQQISQIESYNRDYSLAIQFMSTLVAAERTRDIVMDTFLADRLYQVYIEWSTRRVGFCHHEPFFQPLK